MIFQVELLLESCTRQLDDERGRVEQLKQTINSTKEVVTLDLDRARNRMLRLNVYMTMGAVGVLMFD